YSNVLRGIFFKRKQGRSNKEFFIGPVFFERGITAAFHIGLLHHYKTIEVKVLILQQLLRKQNVLARIGAFILNKNGFAWYTLIKSNSGKQLGFGAGPYIFG